MNTKISMIIIMAFIFFGISEGQTLDPCVSFPCQRNGTCIRESNTTYTCVCLSIAYGDDCEYVNPCASFPCQHGGSCKPNGTDYKCSCANSASGNNCQYLRDSATNSTIFNVNTMQKLRNLLNIPTNRPMKLLYRGSTDGFSPYTFHQKCDGVLGTLTVIRSINQNIFGGYTEVDWIGSGYKYDSSAFLFSLKNLYNIPIKLNVKNPQNSIYTYNYYSPTFGNSHDLYTNLNSNPPTGYTYLGNYGYEAPYFLSSDKYLSFLAGSYNFQIDEIEVFSVELDALVLLKNAGKIQPISELVIPGTMVCVDKIQNRLSTYLRNKYKASEVVPLWTVENGSYLLNIQFYAQKSIVNDTTAIMNDWVDVGANTVFSPSNLPTNYTYTPTICNLRQITCKTPTTTTAY